MLRQVLNIAIYTSNWLFLVKCIIIAEGFILYRLVSSDGYFLPYSGDLLRVLCDVMFYLSSFVFIGYHMQMCYKL